MRYPEVNYPQTYLYICVQWVQPINLQCILEPYFLCLSYKNLRNSFYFGSIFQKQHAALLYVKVKFTFMEMFRAKDFMFIMKKSQHLCAQFSLNITYIVVRLKMSKLRVLSLSSSLKFLKINLKHYT